MYCLFSPTPGKMGTSRRVGRSALRKVSIPPSLPLTRETRFNNNALSPHPLHNTRFHTSFNLHSSPLPYSLLCPPHSQAAPTLSVSPPRAPAQTSRVQQRSHAATHSPHRLALSPAFPRRHTVPFCHLLGWCPSGRSRCPGSLGVSCH